MDRRTFLRTGVGAASGVAVAALSGVTPTWASEGLAHPGPSPFGSLDGRGADRNGVVLPEGFRSRIVAVGGVDVAGTNYRWHPFSGGGATIADGSGGWYYVSNSDVEDPTGQAGASAIHFDHSGKIVGASRILEHTTANGGGGATPRGTWLSCEAIATGRIWECDPRGSKPPARVDGLGVFRHASVAVATEYTALYMTEDEDDGLLYRFVPDRWPDLSVGRLQALRVDGGTVRWIDIRDPSAAGMNTRAQAPDATVFKDAGGMCYRAGFVYFTTSDNRVHMLDVQREAYSVVWDGTDPLTGADQLTADPVAGQLFIGEDGGKMQIVIIDNEGNVAPFLRVDGHPDSEIAGVAFSPDETRLYFSSQRGPTAAHLSDVVPGAVDTRPIGMVFEIEGPFLEPETAAARIVDRTSGGSGRRSPAPYAAAGGSVIVAGVAGVLALRNRRSHG